MVLLGEWKGGWRLRTPFSACGCHRAPHAVHSALQGALAPSGLALPLLLLLLLALLAWRACCALPAPRSQSHRQLGEEVHGCSHRQLGEEVHGCSHRQLEQEEVRGCSHRLGRC